MVVMKCEENKAFSSCFYLFLHALNDNQMGYFECKI